jgi:hypothetical protein
LSSPSYLFIFLCVSAGDSKTQLRLLGVTVGEEGSTVSDPTFLMEMMEKSEAVAEAQTADARQALLQVDGHDCLVSFVLLSSMQHSAVVVVVFGGECVAVGGVVVVLSHSQFLSFSLSLILALCWPPQNTFSGTQ